MPYTGYTGSCVIIPATHALTKDQQRELVTILNAHGLRVRICTRLRDAPTNASDTDTTSRAVRELDDGPHS